MEQRTEAWLIPMGRPRGWGGSVRNVVVCAKNEYKF